MLKCIFKIHDVSRHPPNASDRESVDILVTTDHSEVVEPSLI